MNLLAEVKDATGWPDVDIADMVGLTRITVNRASHGANVRMRDMKTEHLRDALVELRDKLQTLIDYIDLTS
jgi:hypothetical protein